MLCNLHTHSTYCDGNNTLEEIVHSAIEQGFHSLGFSGHGYTPYDLSYCIKDMNAYMAEVKSLQEKYRKDIEIYLGVEEDFFAPVDRSLFDYILGSAHYCKTGGNYYSVDSKYECREICLSAFHNDPIAMAKAYYEPFCAYIHKRKPDIIGHFDLITKYDEKYAPMFLNNPQYHKIAEEAIGYAADAGCLFEVNTGAIARELRTTPYPYENLLQIIKKKGNGIVLSSDAHNAEKLSFGFADTKLWLKDLGFTHSYILSGGKFIPVEL